MNEKAVNRQPTTVTRHASPEVRSTSVFGQTLVAIDTPALIVDLPALERNVAKMQAACDANGVRLRPHCKTHKCPEIAWKQMQAGARGITCAKLGEAEVMARAGIRDLLIANQVVGPLKMARLIDLARISDVIVAVDSEANAREIDQAARSAGLTINVLIEVDSGMHRCGTAPGEPTLTLARRVLSLTGLRFRGVMGYEGHAVALADRDLRVAGCESSAKLLVEAAEYVRANGIPVEIVSAGGTGSFDITGKVPGITELQCGSYATHDRAYREIGVEFENALTVLSTIISRPAPDRVIIDCGRKSCAPDHGMPAVRQRTDLDCVYLSEEHGKCNVLNPSCPLGPGDRIELIPGHGCTTINLHDEFYAVREGVVEAVWTIAARGKSR